MMTLVGATPSDWKSNFIRHRISDGRISKNRFQTTNRRKIRMNSRNGSSNSTEPFLFFPLAKFTIEEEFFKSRLMFFHDIIPTC